MPSVVHAIHIQYQQSRLKETACFVRAGKTEVAPDKAEELLRAADQYMLEGLKCLCEEAISKDLSVDNIMAVYELSEDFNAAQLGRHCVLYALEHYEVTVDNRLFTITVVMSLKRTTDSICTS